MTSEHTMLQGLAITGLTDGNHCSFLRSVFGIVSRLRRRLRTEPATAEMVAEELCGMSAVAAVFGFLYRSDLGKIEDDEGYGTAVNACSCLLALGGGHLAWQEDSPFPEHPWAPSVDVAAVAPVTPLVDAFPYAAAVEAMVPFLDAEADELERPIILYDMIVWLTDDSHAARAALLGSEEGRQVAVKAIKAMLPVSEGAQERQLRAALSEYDTSKTSKTKNAQPKKKTSRK